MRVMQIPFNTIQHHTETGALDRLDSGAQVMQQGFDFAPVDVATDRILKDGVNQMFVLVAHGNFRLLRQGEQNTGGVAFCGWPSAT